MSLRRQARHLAGVGLARCARFFELADASVTTGTKFYLMRHPSAHPSAHASSARPSPSHPSTHESAPDPWPDQTARPPVGPYPRSDACAIRVKHVTFPPDAPLERSRVRIDGLSIRALDCEGVCAFLAGPGEGKPGKYTKFFDLTMRPLLRKCALARSLARSRSGRVPHASRAHAIPRCVGTARWRRCAAAEPALS